MIINNKIKKNSTFKYKNILNLSYFIIKILFINSEINTN